MAINPDIRDQAYQFFIEEAPELLQIIEAGLLTLSQERSTAKIHTLMRAAHSIKGGAASVGLETIAALAHRLENIFKALYSDSVETHTELENLLLQACDCLRLPLTNQIDTGTFDQAQALAAAEPIFSQIEAYCGEALTQTESYIPSSAEMGVDLVVSIFEVDIAQGLAQLAIAVANPQDYDLRQELQTQTEVFAGFAELLNLPSFGAIAQAVQQALSRHDDRALEIAQLALIEFERSRQAVLAGDRTSTSLSPALIALASENYSFNQQDTISEPLLESNQEESYSISEYDLLPVEPTDSTTASVIDLTSEVEEFLLEDIFGAALSEPDDLIEADRFAAPWTESVADEIEIESVELDSTATEAALEVELEAEPEQVTLSFTSTSSAEEPDLPIVAHADLAPQLAAEPELAPAATSPTTADLNWTPIPIQPPAAATPPTPLTVRVDSDRLERMNNLVGELSINRSSLSLQSDQLQQILRELRSRFSRFRTLVSQLQGVSDEILIAPERTEKSIEAQPIFNGQPFRSTLSAYANSIEFDALEMDRYGVMHSHLQEVLEDLVQLEESVDDIGLFTRQSSQTLEQHQYMLTQLRDELVWARMLPLGEILNRFPRILRDLSVTYQKPVNLKLVGAEVLIDRAILEKLYDPLLHLLRNAFDHGIESATTRQQQGKSEVGKIEVRACHKGNQTVIEVRDDGQGINLDRIRARILELGWFSSEQLARITPAQLFELIFEPNFSTASQVSELSGRGFGLNVVRSQLQSIRGSVSIASVLGQGTIFTLSLPLTLTITQLVICLVGALPVALPASNIADIWTPKPNQIQQTNTERLLHWRERWIPTYSLTQLLGYACPLPTAPGRILATFPAPKDWASPVIVLQHEHQTFALEVDRILTEQELVIKPFGAAIAPPSYVYGCTILGDGSPIPVIDAIALLNLDRRSAHWPQPQPIPLQSVTTAIDDSRKVTYAPQMPTVLVIDDAITLRRTLALFLEREGFRVLQAQDGQEAIQQFQTAAVQIIICDVEMPNMNGFEFLSYRRQEKQLSQVPVVMLTSRSNEKHQWLATQLGATAYLTKPYLEQDLLSTLRDLLKPTPTKVN